MPGRLDNCKIAAATDHKCQVDCIGPQKRLRCFETMAGFEIHVRLLVRQLPADLNRFFSSLVRFFTS